MRTLIVMENITAGTTSVWVSMCVWVCVCSCMCESVCVCKRDFPIYLPLINTLSRWRLYLKSEGSK